MKEGTIVMKKSEGVWDILSQQENHETE